MSVLDRRSDRQTIYRNAVAARAVAIAAAIAFAVLVTVKGIPTLRHDWNWPIDAAAIPSFIDDSFSGWLPAGIGIPNAHPTPYLIALPLVAVMWLLGPLAALVVFAFVTGYLCARSGAAIAAASSDSPGAVALGSFALFNPWVYNEVVAGHLVMVFAYGAFLGCMREMLRGREASPVRLALWLALVEAQLQFFIVAMLALIVFAGFTKKWLPVAAGVVFILPSAIGLIAERGALLQTPYGLTWQANQSVAPGALLGLGGYFPGYSERLGIAASIAVWLVIALAAVGTFLSRRTGSAIAAAACAFIVFFVVTGLHGPFAVPYEWIVRRVPESGVFRELYDLAGVFTALVALLASAALARKPLQYIALSAGIALPVTWIVHPPSGFWIGAGTYPHPAPSAPPFVRIALLPAFQPLQLRSGDGDGADPDAFVYPGRVAPINQYFPTFPVDMALADFEQNGDYGALRALGVGEIVARPWLESRYNGAVGLAATSLPVTRRRFSVETLLYVAGPTPLVSECTTPHIVTFAGRLGACNIFFADAPGYEPIHPIVAPGDSIDPRDAWIDARLAFARAPELAQAIGGALTQSRVPFPVTPGSWLLANVRGRLLADGGSALAARSGGFVWLPVPPNVSAVRCDGLCELVAESPAIPLSGRDAETSRVHALEFRSPAPWLYFVTRENSGPAVLRLNERYDAAWIGITSWHLLEHIRVDMSVNGWLVSGRAPGLILVQITALLQLIAEIVGIVCLLMLLKALQSSPTKRAP
jgi:hypothetical protein